MGLRLLAMFLPLSASAQLLVLDSGSGEWNADSVIYRRVGESVDIRLDGMRTSQNDGPYWYSIIPLARDYDNTQNCSTVRGCLQPIQYERRELPSLQGKTSIRSAEADFLNKSGTHYLQASDGPQAAKFSSIERPPGLQIIVRQDDSYTGYLTELLGVPFVLWPQRMTDGKHQTDARTGADCVALVIYGQRRLGRRIPYMAPAALSGYTDVVQQSSSGAQAVQVGDILHFGYQTAVVLEDKPPIGVLNGDDLIIHSYHTVAEIVPFSRLPYRNSHFEVRRWFRQEQS